MKTAEEWLDIFPVGNIDNEQDQSAAIKFIRAIQSDAASAPGVMDEPTKDMIEAGAKAACADFTGGANDWPETYLSVDADQFRSAANACYRAMLAAAPKQPCGWRDIKTAPRDGTEIIISGKYKNGTPFVEQNFCFDDGIFSGRQIEQPTHWQPLPPPPKKGQPNE